MDLMNTIHLLYNKKGALEMNIFKYFILTLKTALYDMP